jgi:LacI family transcriptional regulator
MTTMAEIAQEAGVSTTTVSHALNGTRKVSEKTMEKVRAAIARTGYEPNSIARALTGARTRSIGAAISGISNRYFMDVIAAVEAEAAEHGHTLLLGDTREEWAKELQMVQELVRRRVDGLIMAPSPMAREYALKYLMERSVPVVLVDRLLELDIDQVGSENFEPMALLIDHLASNGHVHIALIAGLPGLSTTEERIFGYRTSMDRNNLDVDEALIEYGKSKRDPAREATHRLMDSPEPPSALVVGNNAMTIGALIALRERGLKVPRDIALVAFDDFEWSDAFEPRLTVIAQPTYEIGKQAVDLLLARLDNPTRPFQKVRLATTFIHRDSCGCA